MTPFKDKSEKKDKPINPITAGGEDSGKSMESTVAPNAAQKTEAVYELAASATAAAPENRAKQIFNEIREARIKGYEGDMCDECGQFTMIRNGTCLKCDTCGATSGCS